MKCHNTLSGILICSGFLAAPAAEAQAVEEITVTAQKRQESLQDVPISISAFGSEQIKSLGIDSTLDLALYTPGLTMGQNSGDGDFPFISIRGVSQRDFSDINESPSAVYIDEFYKANLVGLDLQVFDIERVEVLRGPQGTLYGRNATGGLIHYITAKPTDQAEGYVDATYGEYNKFKLEGAVGGPLTETLGARLSMLHHEYDGWVENTYPGGEDGNALDATSVRGQLLFKPTDDLRLSLLLQHSSNDNDAGNMFQHVSADDPAPTFLAVPNPGQPGFNGYIEETPNNPRDTHSNRDIYLKTEQTTGIARAEWSFGSLDFVSITGVESSSKDATFDSDGTPFQRGTEVHPDGKEFSQELRVAGSTERSTWMLGAFYIDYDIDGSQSRCAPAGCATNRRPVLYDLATESYALFANLDYRFTDTVSATLGLRYSKEKKEYDLNNSDNGFVFNTGTVGDQAKIDEDDVDFSVRLNWKPATDTLIYGGVSRAHKAGLFNLGFTTAASAAAGIPVDGETLTSYETGFKQELWEGKARVNAALFYYDYKDSQAFQFDGSTLSSQAFNSDAVVKGGELELAVTPLEGLDVMGNVAYTDATLQDVTLPGLQVVDTQMPLTPEWQATLITRYQWAAPWSGRLALQADVSWIDDQYFDSFNSPSHHEDSYSIVNARLTWSSEDEKWRVSVFGENITDEEYRTFSFDLAFLGFSTDVYGKPSWYGVTVGYSF
jgi:iron complex outermembrane recepter protein